MGIKLEKVNFSYSGKSNAKDVLSNINLSIESNGEFISICGKTGSGKSSLVQLFNLLNKPTSGTITIFDKVYNSKSTKVSEVRTKVGLVFQFPEYQLFEDTVFKDIMFGPKNLLKSENEAKRRTVEVCKLLNISKEMQEKSPLKLSGGEKRKVAIAGIIALNPKILVLDEPTSGLDPKSQKDILNLLVELQKEKGMTIIVVTHDMDIVAEYSSRVIVLKEGKIAFDDSPSELFKNNNESKYSLKVPSSINFINKLNELSNSTYNNDNLKLIDVINELTKK